MNQIRHKFDSAVWWWEVKFSDDPNQVPPGILENWAPVWDRFNPKQTTRNGEWYDFKGTLEHCVAKVKELDPSWHRTAWRFRITNGVECIPFEALGI